MRYSKEKIILISIIILGGFFRFYGINWDQGHHLHPDERAIVMNVLNLKPPHSISEFMTPLSPWNPHFFAYGSFPMYLLWAAGNLFSFLNPLFNQYDSINLIGRGLSALIDLVTILLLYKIARKLFNPSTGVLAAFFYTISVLPIQLSHYYAVDTFLTCFVLATLYAQLIFYEKPTISKALLIGLFFGLSLATKTSALVLIASIGTTLIVDFMFIFLRNPRHSKHWLPHLPKFAIHLVKFTFIICATTLLTFLLLEPYAAIDFQNFWAQTIQQSTLTNNPFYFPYTLQYVGKIPYLYELKNISLWGEGPVLALFSIVGFLYYIYDSLRNNPKNKHTKAIIILVFFLAYVITVGRFAVGFMRYMLPTYPFLALFAAVLIYRIAKSIKSKSRVYAFYFLLFTFMLIWPLSFMHIYSKNNTRVEATKWINLHIPTGKTIAIEHWDDGLPLTGGEKYQIVTLALYDPDTDVKWAIINRQLRQADYIIVASNRLYAPILKLTDCRRLPIERCYPQTAAYYQDLLAGNLGFQKVAEFTNYPTVPLLNIKINDQTADESFTVNERPKVMIFQKSSFNSTM